jgi:hypothetical protein
VTLEGKEKSEVVEVLKVMPREVTFDVRHSNRLERKISRRHMSRTVAGGSTDRDTAAKVSPRSAEDLQAAAMAASRHVSGEVSDEASRDTELDIIVEKKPGESLGFGVAGGAGGGSGKPLTIRRVSGLCSISVLLFACVVFLAEMMRR